FSQSQGHTQRLKRRKRRGRRRKGNQKHVEPCSWCNPPLVSRPNSRWVGKGLSTRKARHFILFSSASPRGQQRSPLPPPRPNAPTDSSTAPFTLGFPAMKTCLLSLGVSLLVFAPWSLSGRADKAAEIAFPRFRVQEIETGLKVGYAVLLVDI